MPPRVGSDEAAGKGAGTRAPRLLLVASGGGHWIQLRRLAPAWEGCDAAYVTTNEGYRNEVAPARCYVVPDANRWSPLRLAHQLLRILIIVLRERPDVVITTGAAPGYFALRLARLLRARTAWIDSIANAEELSLSGRQAGPHADLWLTQWEHLARPGGPRYEGAVL